MTLMCYSVCIERGAKNYSAYVKELPGCVATGKTMGAVKRAIREAIRMHVEGMRLGADANRT